MPLIDALVQPADDREIEAFKAWAKYPVPDEYLAFLREHNGGYLTGDAPCFYDSSDCTVVCITKFMHVSQDLDKCISKMFEKHFEFNTVKTQSEELRDNYFAPDYYIKIADGAQHGHILLDLKTGYIFSFDDETEEELETTEDFLEESFIIADSFDSFFSKIVDEGPDWLD
ncbi:SMI1/KNR4 family protein [Pseudovibrio sp. WM33]|uniref:SMI1/KNR4 family protein n=1 Tax=Pseudovibrio sp. WM33 TaxID=1735585 RepID=UPI0007AEBF7E|nr:SMI1/KNR4 family protein [Pseudovibrio sp. WM33]KZL21913.1 SMI1 / KNR4 family protein [Pseudovibrio sp. WM33]